MTKIKMTRPEDGGFKGKRQQVKVMELPDGEPLPMGAETVADETPVHDWQDEQKVTE